MYDLANNLNIRGVSLKFTYFVVPGFINVAVGEKIDEVLIGANIQLRLQQFCPVGAHTLEIGNGSLEEIGVHTTKLGLSPYTCNYTKC
jgi:hypothetical protein